jgi:hypothetical protein
MPQIKTSQGRPVSHRHSEVTLSQETIAAAREWMERHFPNAVEKKQASCNYNCHGFTLANRHGWFDDPTRFLEDDFEKIAMNEARVGDLLIYKKGDRIAHSASVTKVFEGRILKVRSKWGAQSEVIHHPDDVDDDFGCPNSLYRKRSDAEPPDFKDDDLDFTDAEAVNIFIRNAFERLSEPNVYLKLMIASTPEVARSIIADLPGVSELIRIGPMAGKVALEVFETAAARQNHFVTNITSYILQWIPMEEARRPLARFLLTQQVNCFDQDLVAEAFLASSGIEVESNFRSVAFREAQKFVD